MTISRKSRIGALFALLAMAAMPLACTSTGVFRTDGDGCAKGVWLSAQGDVESQPGSGKFDTVKCSTTTYHLPLKNPQPGDSTEFTYSFLELNEREPTELKSADQWQKLDDVLKNGRQKYVITFIHGWRNDASLGAKDGRRFRTLLTYSRQFLNHRCRRERRYCDTQLIGVFIGWRGALVTEIGENFSFPAVLWTFWNRKQKSEQHAEGIVRHIKAIESRLHLDPGNPGADKMLVLGHSFGGNMLATALHECLTGDGDPKVFCGEGAQKIRKIDDYVTKQPAAPPLGDLTVIVNPAAELKKWSDIQRAVRRRNGHDGAKALNRQVDTLFRRDQRPTYIALTAARDWSNREICKDEKGQEICDTDYDTATGFAFTLGQFYRKDPERKIAIGHAVPNSAHPYGASHEVITNESHEAVTTLVKGLDPKQSVCDVQDGWLWQARGFDEAYRGYWDTVTKSRNRLHVSTGQGGARRVAQQFRQGLFPSVNVDSHASFEPSNTPFWSVRAAPNAIPAHSTYINYPLWCSLNQMVLDDITWHGGPREAQK
ncbi:hypothetical protein [Shinella sp.]|uniref:hypothetical protein n=1 Tax=Shinella sp. TaxID=1870904 RepID=UPI00301B7D5C